MTSSPSIILKWSRSVETSVYCVVNPVEFPSAVGPCTVTRMQVARSWFVSWIRLGGVGSVCNGSIIFEMA